MKAALLLALSLTFGVTAASSAQAAACPNHAGKASYAVWGPNTLRGTVTGSHPCGKKLSCSPGRVDVKGSRNCKWI